MFNYSLLFAMHPSKPLFTSLLLIKLEAVTPHCHLLYVVRYRTYCVQIEVSQCVLQPVEVLSNGDLGLKPWRKAKPVTKKSF